MEPSAQPNNGVWISREEYDRLRATPSPAGAPAPFSPVTTVAPPTRRTHLLEIIGVLVAILTFVGLTVDGAQVSAIFGLVGLLVLAVFSSKDLMRGRGQLQAIRGQAAWEEPKPGHSTTFKVVRALVIAGILVVCAPFLYTAAMITLFIVICTASSCRGS